MMFCEGEMVEQSSTVLQCLYDQRDATIFFLQHTHGRPGRINLDLDARLARKPLYDQLDAIFKRIYQERRRVSEAREAKAKPWKP